MGRARQARKRRQRSQLPAPVEVGNADLSDHFASRTEELIESAPAALPRAVTLREVTSDAVGAGAPRDAGDGGTRRQITIIEAGWGSSGYYAKEVLARDGAKAWPIGTHMYLNHPGEFEDSDRPERNVADLVGVIASTPRMEGNALVAEADVFAHWTPMINEVADHIGVSIRAMGEMEYGEAEGRQGVIVKSLDEGISVDYVTKAGAGGKVGQLIESARAQSASIEEARNAGTWFEASIHREFTLVADSMFGNGYLTREERIALSSAIGDALDAFTASLKDAAPGLYERDPYADPERESGTVEERQTAHEAVKPSREDDDMSDVDKQELDGLKESVERLEKRIETVEAERDEHKVARERAEDALLRHAAEKVIAEARIIPEGSDKEIGVFEGLPERAVTRAKEAALKGELPTNEDGKLNEGQLRERAVKAAKEEREYLREAGVSNTQVEGMGASPAPADDGDAPKKLAESFQRIGLGEDAAKIAAGGR